MRDLKEDAKSIFLETLKSIQLDSIIRNRLYLSGDQLVVDGYCLDLAFFREVVLIGLGKASASLGPALEGLLGDRLSRGLLVTNGKPVVSLKSEVVVAGHPLPNAASLEAGKRLIQIIESCDHDSLVLLAISGGGSALAESPLSSDITLEDLRELNRVLISSGATIREINIVRKHLSRLKGGRLGYLARDIRSLALFVSDVYPGDLRSIASNPLLPDEATLEEFHEVLDRYGLIDRIPGSIANLIRSGAIQPLPTWDVADGRRVDVLLLENADAVAAAALAAEARGFRVEVDNSHSEEDYRVGVDGLIERLVSAGREGDSRKVCLISGGEFSCPVSGGGFGGRNQEFVLYCAARLAARGLSGRAAVLSCGTDGIDGNSSAVGAVSDGYVFDAADQAGLDATSFITENNSTSFFCEAGGLIITGPTCNNVRDLRLLLMN